MSCQASIESQRLNLDFFERALLVRIHVLLCMESSDTCEGKMSCVNKGGR